MPRATSDDGGDDGEPARRAPPPPDPRDPPPAGFAFGPGRPLDPPRVVDVGRGVGFAEDVDVGFGSGGGVGLTVGSGVGVGSGRGVDVGVGEGFDPSPGNGICARLGTDDAKATTRAIAVAAEIRLMKEPIGYRIVPVSRFAARSRDTFNQTNDRTPRSDQESRTFRTRVPETEQPTPGARSDARPQGTELGQPLLEWRVGHEPL